ncbi:DUF7344 domain-containing protein [Haladaptatus sp. DFWS20]|uniref:DUF7344 domain-containing protein n=1 Tax=Haladaptatus sp. DFWS20 TaxID=3403467 RepID=UPI003EB85600
MKDQYIASQPSLDNLLDVLSDTYRRRLLIALLEHNPQDDEDPQIPNDVKSDDEALESLKLQMRHSHLPKLEDTGFIEWDQHTNTVRKGPRFEEIRPILELMHNHADELPSDWL